MVGSLFNMGVFAKGGRPTVYFGEYKHQIDAKGRIRIPTKLKSELGNRPFITCSSNKCLLVLPFEEAIRIFTQQFSSLNPFSPDDKQVRLMSAKGFAAEEDSVGRILLPDYLIKHAELKKNIVTIGAFNRVEIWSEENWLEYSGIDSKEFDDCLRNVGGKRDDS